MYPPRKQIPQSSRPRPQPVAGPSRLGPGPATARVQGATSSDYNRQPPAPILTSSTHKSFYQSRDGAPTVPNFMSWDPDDTPTRRSGVKMMRTRANHGAARKSTQIQRERPPGGRYYLKNGRLARLSDSSDDDRSDDDHNDNNHNNDDHNDGQGYEHDDLEDMYMDPPEPPMGQVARKAATRMSAVPRSAARKVDVEVISISSDSSSDDGTTEISSLLHAFAAVSISTQLRKHKRLPFLRRNVRRGFLYACRSAQVPTHPTTRPTTAMEVTYQYPARQDAIVFQDLPTKWEETFAKAEGWKCPLCDIHGTFGTAKMLQFHVQADHPEVDAQWSYNIQDDKHQVTLRYDSRRRESIQSDDEFSQDESNGEPEPVDQSIVRQETPEIEMPPTPIVQLDDLPPISGRTRPKYAVMAPHPEDFLRPPARQPRTGYDEDGRLAPPPRDKLCGPAAEPPLESCRPGGPRLYDLLNELPLDEFGILSWAIVDREEEIFEFADICDEDKVMMALWNRWIMLYRREFLFNGYYDGVVAFLDRYHAMIHRAAGFDALRNFLLVLAGNKYLKMRDVAQALRYYEKLVKMDEWYKEDTQPGQGS